MNLDVVVIDDDAVILFLHKVLIKKSKLPSTLQDFSNAKDALQFIRQRETSTPLLIFLDINMPRYSGWDFLEELDHLPNSNQVFVVMVTSSINESDRMKAAKFSRVIDYREKPLSTQACHEIYTKVLALLNS